MNCAVITALNEEQTIGTLVRELREQGLDVFVCDDGSTDKTRIQAIKNGAEVVRHETPRGIRESLMELWRLAIIRRYDYIVQIDAGGSHNAFDWCAWDWHDRPDITIGSRFNGGQYIGRQWRAFASRATAAALNWATHRKITDWTSGYRVFSRRALELLVKQNYMTTAHTWQIEVLHAAIDNNLTVAEFPITYRAGESSLKLKTIDDLIKVYLWVLTK